MKRNPMNAARALHLTALALLLAAPALAEPVVSPGGRPGVATAWERAGDAVLLTVDADYDASVVADAVREAMPKAKVTVEAGKVVVRGVADKDLLSALEAVDVPSMQDDVDAMLSALQNPGGDDDGSGSSIRAGKKVDFDEVKGPPGPLVVGEVLKVRRGRYPLVLIQVKIDKAPARGAGPKRGKTVQVLPYVKAKDGVVDSTHAQSQLNVGAWYTQRGDKVKLRLEPEPRNGVWVAKAFERVE